MWVKNRCQNVSRENDQGRGWQVLDIAPVTALALLSEVTRQLLDLSSGHIRALSEILAHESISADFRTWP